VWPGWSSVCWRPGRDAPCGLGDFGRKTPGCVNVTRDDSELKRLLLSAFERVRLTTNASAFLDDCTAIARR
jgi:hypothetical protein